MSRILDLPLIVVLIGIGALAMLLPAAHAMALGDEAVARAFAYSALVFLVATAMVAIALSNRRPSNIARSQLASLGGAYLILPVMLAVPVEQAVRDTSFFNAWFEMVSCLTTTGASVYDAPGRLPQSVHLWRILVGWLGGFMVLVCAGALLAPLDLGGAEVMTGRVPGRGTETGAKRSEPTRRLARQTAVLFPAYVGLTLTLWVLLLIVGTDGFAALAFAMSTLSSSGIHPALGFGASGGLFAEFVVFAFLLLALTRRSFPGTWHPGRGTPLSGDPEIRTAVVIMLLVPLVLVLRHGFSTMEDEIVREPWEAVRAYWGALFMTLSFLSTTGFESGSWETARNWAGMSSPGLIFVGLSIIGGGIATTTGGLKLLRVYALYLHGNRELERIIYPSSIGGGGALQRRLQSEGAFAAWIFVILYSLALTVVIGLLALLGLQLDEALVLAVAGLSTTGPLAEIGGDVPIRYADLSGGVRMVLAGAMVLGRLEVLAVLALLAPSAWRQ